MTQKVYPKVVVLKKGLVGVAIVSAALIIILIIHNLYKATHDQRSMQMTSRRQVEAIASSSDTNWYQDKAVQKNNHAATIPAVKTNVPKETPKVEDNMFSQQMGQDLLKAMSAPISSQQLTSEKQPISATPDDTSMIPGGLNQPDTDQNMQDEKKAFIQSNSAALDNDYLGSLVKNPISPYELQAGTIIPGILLTGIHSDLPGQITGQVRSNVYDSISGKYLLIPQGSRLTGLYDSQIAYCQQRVLVVWKRIIFPNGQSINLRGMPGIDMSGYAGFNDRVNNHYGKIFGSVILMSVLGGGAQLAQPPNNTNPFAAPTIGQTLAQSLGTNLTNTGAMITAKNINMQPTLEIRPGYPFNISVTKDMVFPSSYRGD
jgi:type IV secretory pathway VirB10-like protein